MNLTYNGKITPEYLSSVTKDVASFLKSAEEEKNIPLKDSLRILSSIDLTTLDIRDTDEKVKRMCQQVNRLPETFGIEENVAGICVYPVFVPVVRETLKAKNVKIVSVSAGFPAGQTPLDIKVRETEFAISEGAQEIDIVIPAGKVFQGKKDEVTAEIRAIRDVCGNDVVLKVILESGLYEDKSFLIQAAECALEGGADFLKTSTGKVQPAARPEDVCIMSDLAGWFFKNRGKKCGIKAAGGISTPSDAWMYMNLVRSRLGDEWISPGLFRIGASRLANALLSLVDPEKGDHYFH